MKSWMLKVSLVVLVMCILVALVMAPGIATAKSVAHSGPKPHITGFTEACPVVSSLHARCLAIRTNFDSLVPNLLLGYGPDDLQSAYSLPSTIAGGGQTVAIVDAFDDPKAESDLKVYRSRFDLPACTTANGCFRKVNQRGGSTPPSPDPGWTQEISLDLDMVSAICPNCHILLVEADNSSFNNLALAVNEAARYANVISNSYGGSEFPQEMDLAQFYNHPGHVIVASAGDSGYGGGTQIPAAFNTVTAVGGTALVPAINSRGWEETVWSGTGSGCSGFIPKPRWQHDDGCQNRMLNDVAAVADPNTGVAVYDSYRETGWLVFGGTSVSAPIIASVYALSGNATSVFYGSYPYSHTTSLYDVTMGTNDSCDVSYFCEAEDGYDGPTGLGTPDGTEAF